MHRERAPGGRAYGVISLKEDDRHMGRVLICLSAEFRTLEEIIVKKRRLIILLALGLVLLTGCGLRFTESNDSTSKYAYGWKTNSDNTVTVRIKGKWDKDCTWRAEYDDKVLRCEPGKGRGRFVVGSCSAGTGDLLLRLYRQGQEDWEYTLRISVQGNGSGGAIVLAGTHEEPRAEGSYAYYNKGSTAVLTVNTAHLWLSREMGSDLRIDKTGRMEGTEKFEFSARHTSVQGAMVQLYDTEAPLLLTVYADIDADGLVSITRVEESSDTEYGEKNVEQFWKQLGFKAPFSDAVTIRSANVSGDVGSDVYTTGELRVVIEGTEYELFLSLLPRIAEVSVPAERTDLETGETIPVQMTEKTIGLETVQFYQQKTEVTAIWKLFGCHYVLKARAVDMASAERAVAALMGVSANG